MVDNDSKKWKYVEEYIEILEIFENYDKENKSKKIIFNKNYSKYVGKLDLINMLILNKDES